MKIFYHQKMQGRGRVSILDNYQWCLTVVLCTFSAHDLPSGGLKQRGTVQYFTLTSALWLSYTIMLGMDAFRGLSA